MCMLVPVHAGITHHAVPRFPSVDELLPQVWRTLPVKFLLSGWEASRGRAQQRGAHDGRRKKRRGRRSWRLPLFHYPAACNGTAEVAGGWKSNLILIRKGAELNGNAIGGDDQSFTLLFLSFMSLAVTHLQPTMCCCPYPKEKKKKNPKHKRQWVKNHIKAPS